ncbi:MAG: hypothetical protein DSM106950_05375 [Stigonema ocellatum SAG 48.90 = DSM 106950]|nr:hypothetical protein [Stigonema ocellatum SAG 48.90 = DSM 106950]
MRNAGIIIASGLTQLAQRSEYQRSVGKIERGLTTKINRKMLHGLSIALSVPQEYLEAVSDAKEIQQVHSVKFCPRCWIPGSKADPMWHNPKAKYCYISMQLRTNCASCGELYQIRLDRNYSSFLFLCALGVLAVFLSFRCYRI